MMIRALSVISVALACSACISPPAQYEKLSVTLENNIPCFGIRQDSNFNGPVSVYAPSVMKHVGNQWKAINSVDQPPAMRILNSEECIRLDEVDWREGEYDVVLKVVNEKNAIRYAARFILNKGMSGDLLLMKSE
ncbi:putative T6SS immunity periplasmic lipoprotein [Enterobacter sichuanensis]|uniref:Lipoprotein n=1 Tax=Enterobacter sichuanensis TaxID=2071710 RepID=A0ABS6G799_9ENTR|nr:putative T6SS immunity periplasmic lipoprotein [Enterobacter sichuanensis]MBU5922683.1 hypothetical protein [Enterobacter sichuanensis]MCM7883556.1 hypothetical protein [Enterobacter sichuanensis]MCU6425239.1 hypothetical protein [Enterobacter sichuanensis]